VGPEAEQKLNKVTYHAPWHAEGLGRGNRNPLTKKEMERYPAQAWLVTDYKCPNCDADLFGLFGSFTWGMIHGIGFCSHCKKVELRYYHYPIKNKRFELLSVCGFS